MCNMDTNPPVFKIGDFIISINGPTKGQIIGKEIYDGKGTCEIYKVYWQDGVTSQAAARNLRIDDTMPS